MNDQLCAIFLASAVVFLVTWRGLPSQEENEAEDFILLW